MDVDSVRMVVPNITFYRDDRNVVILSTEYCLESIQTLLTYRKTFM